VGAALRRPSRRREPGNDWIVIALGARGIVDAIEIDTAHFKGNFPDSASVDVADTSGDKGAGDALESAAWTELLPRAKLQADSVHQFSVGSEAPVTHVRLNIYPDGGVSRFRIFGRRAT